MCDNTAVRWSEWESERSRIESDTRNRIAKKLHQNMENLEKFGYPQSYIQGMERALEIVRSVRNDDTLKDESQEQQSLFD